LSPDIITLLAAVLVGEAGVLGDDAMLAIGHAIMNRVSSPYSPDTVMEVLFQPRQWNGWGEPTDHHRVLARLILRRQRDPTGGMLYAFSEQDREWLGFPEGDMIYGSGPIFRLHLYKEFPGERMADSPSGGGTIVLCTLDLVTPSEAVVLE